MKSEKGIAFILLIFIVVILIIAAFLGIKFIKERADKENVDNIKSHMLSIQALAKNVKNKNTVNEENALIGLKLELENNETGYEISDKLKEELEKIESADLYIFTQEEVNNNGLSKIEINNAEFYIVDYNANEVYYSLGINGNYSLTSIEEAEKEEKQEETQEESAENSETTEDLPEVQ